MVHRFIISITLCFIENLDEANKIKNNKLHLNIQMEINNRIPPKFKSNPNKLVYSKDICQNAEKSYSIDNVFTTFKSLKGEYIVAWRTSTFNIEIYDLILERLISSTKAHSSVIFTCCHFLDKNAHADLILTTSYDDSVKVWNFSNNMKLIVHIEKAHIRPFLYSACILFNAIENTSIIISSATIENLKIWNFNGKLIKEFGNHEYTYFISTWYFSKNKKYYILNANVSGVSMYNYNDLSIYKTFNGSSTSYHMSAEILEKKDKILLVESDGNGNIRIWDFFVGNLLQTVISTEKSNLKGLCIWNNQYIIASASDSSIKIYDIDNSKHTKSLINHNNAVCSVKTILIPGFGESIISYGLDGRLKLWCQPKL